MDQVVINITDVDCKQRSESSTRDRNYATQSDMEKGGSYADQNPFCSDSIDVLNTLNLFSQNNFDAYCAAYLFTYRDFVGGTLGLAWVGGACSKNRVESEQNVRKSLNTGLVTLVNYGNPVSGVHVSYPSGHHRFFTINLLEVPRSLSLSLIFQTSRHRPT